MWNHHPFNGITRILAPGKTKLYYSQECWSTATITKDILEVPIYAKSSVPIEVVRASRKKCLRLPCCVLCLDGSGLSKVVINFKIVRKEQGRRMTDGMFSRWCYTVLHHIVIWLAGQTFPQGSCLECCRTKIFSYEKEKRKKNRIRPTVIKKKKEICCPLNSVHFVILTYSINTLVMVRWWYNWGTQKGNFVDK